MNLKNLVLHLIRCMLLALYCFAIGVVAIAIGILLGIVLGALSGVSYANTYVYSPLQSRHEQLLGRKVLVGFGLMVIIAAGYFGYKHAIAPKTYKPVIIGSVVQPPRL